MQNIIYFCIMTAFKRIFRSFLLLSSLPFLTVSNLHAQDILTEEMSKVDISLLTCGPGDQVYSLYGHTAIRIQDQRNGQDLVINYGAFNMEKSNFLLNFVFGKADYEMEIILYPYFESEYASQGRWVIAQHLSLSPKDKMAILSAIYKNAEPQNRIYRYNYFYDNCTTRARDILLNNLQEEVAELPTSLTPTTYRKMIYQWTDQHKWTRFGNDLLLGVLSDKIVEDRATQFLPDSLMKRFSKAMITDKISGNSRLLVDSTYYIIPPLSRSISNTWDILTPNLVFCLLAVIMAFITFFEFKRRKIIIGVDALLLLGTGLCGIILTVMIFSEQPTVNINLQILLLNPLSLLMVLPVFKSQRKDRFNTYWLYLSGFLILFLIGRTLQHYADGMMILALILLMRGYSNYKLLGRR